MTTLVQEMPKRIAVKGRPIRFRWFQQIAWGFLAGNLGVLFVVALYYVFVQAKWPGYGSHTSLYLKPYWDNLFSYQSWAADRHDIRNEYEGAFAILVGGSFLGAWAKKGKAIKVAPWWYVAISPLVILIVAFPLIIGGVAFLNHGAPYLWHLWFNHHKITNSVHLNGRWTWLGTMLSGYPWQPFLIGFVTGRIIHRVYAPAGNTIQLYIVTRQVRKARFWTNPERFLPHWPAPPVIRERAWWLWQTREAVPEIGPSLRTQAAVILLGFLAIDAWGGYVKYVIAKGH